MAAGVDPKRGAAVVAAGWAAPNVNAILTIPLHFRFQKIRDTFFAAKQLIIAAVQRCESKKKVLLGNIRNRNGRRKLKCRSLEDQTTGNPGQLEK